MVHAGVGCPTQIAPDYVTATIARDNTQDTKGLHRVWKSSFNVGSARIFPEVSDSLG